MSQDEAIRVEVKDEPLRLNLGAGEWEIPGFIAIDRKTGGEVFPLAYENDSVDEIRASHILEHFGHHITLNVMQEWCRVIKPGGLLRIAVPDYDKLMKMHVMSIPHLEDNPAATPEAMMMGGQTTPDDTHRALFTSIKLRNCLSACRLTHIENWKSEIEDTATISISLNMQGRKLDASTAAALAKPFKVAACLSHPRYGAMSHHHCAHQALPPLQIGLLMTSGPFWGKSLSNCMQTQLDEGADAILTLDYDTLFDTRDVIELTRLLRWYPEIDAVAPIQYGRTIKFPLLSARLKPEDGEGCRERIDLVELEDELFISPTAHFGLTLIRASTLKKFPHPWFKSTPSPSGKWNENAQDDDIWFWNEWERMGNKLYIAPRVVVGHTEEMAVWPNKKMQPMTQRVTDYFKHGKPKDTWA